MNLKDPKMRLYYLVIVLVLLLIAVLISFNLLGSIPVPPT